MSYKTLVVDLENGVVHPRGLETLPVKADALLTILAPESLEANSKTKTLGEAPSGT